MHTNILIWLTFALTSFMLYNGPLMYFLCTFFLFFLGHLAFFWRYFESLGHAKVWLAVAEPDAKRGLSLVERGRSWVCPRYVDVKETCLTRTVMWIHSICFIHISSFTQMPLPQLHLCDTCWKCPLQYKGLQNRNNSSLEGRYRPSWRVPISKSRMKAVQECIGIIRQGTDPQCLWLYCLGPGLLSCHAFPATWIQTQTHYMQYIYRLIKSLL